MNDNQNIHVAAGRTTSRVLAPPGGQTSFTLGTYVPPKKAVVAAAPAPVPASAPPVVVPPPEVVAAAPIAPTAPVATTLPTETRPVSSNAFASGANMNGAQVMTGRPSSRVLAPPGGHTSFRLG